MRVAIIANNARSDLSILDKETLDTIAAEQQVKYDLFFVEPDQVKQTVTELARKGYNAFIIAGGDGTVACAAEVLADSDIPIVILPLGTFNYFARELGHPKDIAELFKIIKNNKIKKVDIASVNDKIFINHTAIGFYSYVLKKKMQYQHILKNYKILKVMYTALNILKVIPVYNLTLQVDGKDYDYETCMVFVGNNYHFTNFWDFGTRQTLSGGLLSVYIFNCKTRWEIIKCLFSMLFNTSAKSQYLIEFVTKNLTISSQAKQINIDIELFKLDGPLKYTIFPKQLSTLVP